jgi:hypothetical protein
MSILKNSTCLCALAADKFLFAKRQILPEKDGFFKAGKNFTRLPHDSIPNMVVLQISNVSCDRIL